MATEERSDRGRREDSRQQVPRRRFNVRRRKVCRFCVDKGLQINYKDSRLLSNFMSDRGKIMPARITGNCGRHQRRLATAIKRARVAALLPFSTAKM